MKWYLSHLWLQLASPWLLEKLGIFSYVYWSLESSPLLTIYILCSFFHWLLPFSCWLVFPSVLGDSFFLGWKYELQICPRGCPSYWSGNNWGLGLELGMDGGVSFSFRFVSAVRVHATAFFIRSSLAHYCAAVRLGAEAPDQGLFCFLLCVPHRKGWLLRKGLGSQWSETSRCYCTFKSPGLSPEQLNQNFEGGFQVSIF